MKIGQPMDSRAITWDKSFAGKYSERFDKAQKFIDAECIRHMVKYTPTLSTNLRKSATRGTKIGSGKIQYTVPYARYQYYGKLMVSSVTGSSYARHGEKKVLTDKDLVYSTFKEPLAGKLWSSTGDSLISSDILGGQTRQHNFILYAVYQSMNDFDRMSNSGVLLELQMWLESYADKHRDTTFTTITEGEERTGVLEKLTCANGMIYAIPNENTNDTVQYQLQIAAQYQI